MELQFANINPETATQEEIQAKINRLTQQKNQLGNEEQAIKIFINSIYGASASPYFVGYNPRIAEAISLQGQDMIFFATKILNKYFADHWHNDKSTHEAMGLKQVSKVLDDVVIYGDTDSTYCSFEEVIKGTDWDEDEGVSFLLGLYNARLEGYINKCFEKYADKFNTDNIQKLELEKISHSAILLAKKKYVLDLAWKDPGISYEEQTKISSKGVEIVQSSTPKFARENLNNLLKILFKEKSQLNLKEFVGELRKLKQKFLISEIEDISQSRRISDYEKYVAGDTTKLVINSGCPIHTRGASIYNFELNNNSDMKKKYHLIKSNDKVRFYYAKAHKAAKNVFSYQPGNYPHEFAPPVDYDMQFSKTIIEPINRFVIAMGFPRIPSNLITSTRLF